MHKPVVLLIRDGWGHRDEKERNAIAQGDCPFNDYLMENYPNTLLKVSGKAVGLPSGYQGNSEVGHMTIGSGRVIYQSLLRINKSIETGDFFKKEAFLKAIENCRKSDSTLHIMGLLQKEGVHAHIDHCMALLELCKQEKFKDVVVHVISDGRDAPVKNTVNNAKELRKKMDELGVGRIATISGRYYSMDRNKFWERTKKAYDCIAKAECGSTFENPIKAFEDSYGKGVTDEFIVPTRASWYNGIKEKDSVIFFNYRTDRTRQLTRAMIEDEFEGWGRKPLDILFVAMTEFYKPMSQRAIIAFGQEDHKNLLGKVISDAGLKQLRISETEKYAHVTFFFNGQVEEPNKNEERILIPSPDVETYDMKPEMSVNEIGDKIVEELDKDYSLIVTNFVNGDMVGHTGNWEAILKAVNAVDSNVKKVVEKTLEKGGTVMVFADHGNCEDVSPDWSTSHTINPVPFILVSNDSELKSAKLKEGRGLKDVAPTVLKILDIEKPDEMTGESLY
jgi:2,3-bisphosphoglycerate-independent phosphoglycerate mutase